jgi:hypothetical protein
MPGAGLKESLSGLLFSCELNRAREPVSAMRDMTDIAGRSLQIDFADYRLGFLVNLVQTMHRTENFPHDSFSASKVKIRI